MKRLQPNSKSASITVGFLPTSRSGWNIGELRGWGIEQGASDLKRHAQTIQRISHFTRIKYFVVLHMTIREENIH